MYKTILVDDERNAIRLLKQMLEQYKELEIVGAYIDPLKALEFLKDNKVDVIFLDIEMRGVNGIKIGEKILDINSNSEVIFVTAYNYYAVEAFDIYALDYILKPINKKRLDKTINRIINKLSKDNYESCANADKRILCFSGFEVIKSLSNNETVKWRTRKTKELFAYLVHNRSRHVRKQEIIQDIWRWEDKYSKKAETHLYTTVYNLRKLLKGMGIEKGVIYKNECYKINIQGISVDIDEFEKLINEYEKGQRNKDYLENAIDLYTGDYMGIEDYWWAKEERDNYKNIHQELIKKRG